MQQCVLAIMVTTGLMLSSQADSIKPLPFKVPAKLPDAAAMLSPSAVRFALG
jgi:hypothetical protein